MSVGTIAMCAVYGWTTLIKHMIGKITALVVELISKT